MVLDSTNNVFVGPEGYFKIVIDEFDGENIKAWHFEDVEGNKSVNLAGFANGQHIDLLANIACSTVGTFATRNAIKMIENEQQAKGLIMSK